MTDIGTIVPRVGIAIGGKVVGIGISLRSSLGFRCSYSLGLTPLASMNVSSMASVEPAVVGRSSVEATIVGVSVSSGLGSGLRLGNSRGKQGEKNQILHGWTL